MTLEKFALNQATTKHWPLDDLVDGCVAAGVPAVGLWREDVAAYGVAKAATRVRGGGRAGAARRVREAGLAVSSLCRGGFFDKPDWFDENRRAIDEAATLGTDTLVLVSGGLTPGSRDLDGARRHVGDSVGALVPHAVQAGVRLAIEPLHPMYCSDRCVVSTLGQALALAEPYPVDAVGVVVDTYHLWWDDRVWQQIAERPERIAAYQIADWLTPLPAGVLLGRGLPGTGCVDLPRFAAAVREAGYDGWTEVEVFNEEVWARPGAEVLAEAVAGYREHLR
jgi:sugar phosphate isomerase/epimerase